MFGHVIEENVQVECTRLWYAVICMVSRKIVVPLPKITDKRCFDVDLDLLHVKLRPGDLMGGFKQAGVTGEPLKYSVALMQRHRCSNSATILFGNVGRVGVVEE